MPTRLTAGALLRVGLGAGAIACAVLAAAPAGAQTLTSAANQTFVVGALPTAANA